MNLYDVYLCSGGRFGRRRQAVHFGDPPPAGAVTHLHTVTAVNKLRATSDNPSVRESLPVPRTLLETPVVRLPKGKSIVCPVCRTVFPAQPSLAARLHCYTRHGFRFRLADIKQRGWSLGILDGLPLPDLDAETEDYSYLVDNAAPQTDEVQTDEARAEAFTALLDAILTWDHRRGRFAAYAAVVIFRHLHFHTDRPADDLGLSEKCAARSSFWGIGDAEKNGEIIDWLWEKTGSSLADRERTVVLELMGGGTTTRAAEVLGISKELARQIKERAFSKLRTMAVRDGMLEACEKDRLDEPMKRRERKKIERHEARTEGRRQERERG